MKATILTSCYNCGPWIKECMRSVHSQTYTDWEWIIVDDGSTDVGVKLMKRAANKFDKIRLVRNNKKQGCGASYDVALKHATGDICCVLDADDALASKKSLARLVQLYNKHPEVAYIWTQFNFCDPDLNMVKRGSCRLPNTSFLQAGLDYTKYRHCFSHWRTFRTHLRDKGAVIFNPSLPAAVDKWMGYTLEELGVGGFVNEVLYLYRQRIGGLSYRGRKHWSRMLQEFNKKRKEKGIKPYPTKRIGKVKK